MEKRTAIQFGRILLSLILVSLAACNEQARQLVPYYEGPAFTPIWTLTEKQKETLHTIDEFNLTNQYGEEVSKQTIEGNVCLVNFFFTSCPSICPKLMACVKEVHRNFEGNKNVVFLSHSVTPDIDSVSRLFQYARQNGYLSEQWHLLTGSKDKIYKLARHSYFIEEEMGLQKQPNQFLHTENFVLIDKQGHIRGLYNGTLQAEVPRITEDIKALLGE